MAEKQRKKKTTQPTAVPPGHFAGALYHDDAPRDFGPQIVMPAGDGFRYLVPDQATRSLSNDDGDGNENATKQ